MINYSEQHFKLAIDEFEKVIEGVNQVDGVDALVVSLATIPDINAIPGTFQDSYETYKDMVGYVSGKFTNNSSRIFIGRGSEACIVLMSLFLEKAENSVFENFIVTNPSPKYMSEIINVIKGKNVREKAMGNKLHFSFSKSNNHKKCMQLINLIKRAQFPWLQFEFTEYENNDFENAYCVSFAAGLAFIFKN